LLHFKRANRAVGGSAWRKGAVAQGVVRSARAHGSHESGAWWRIGGLAEIRGHGRKITGNPGYSRNFRGKGRIGSQIHRAVNQRRREFVEFPPAGAAEAGEFSPSQASACGSDCPGEHAFVIPLRLIPDDLDPLRIGLVSSWLCRTPARWARSQQPYRNLPLAPRPASCPSRCVAPEPRSEAGSSAHRHKRRLVYFPIL